MAKRVNSANLIVRDSIETALIQLMEKKPFGEITISEIVGKAGVSRVSYYRNYYYKEEVLFAKMEMLLFLEFHFTHMVYFHLSENR